MRPDLEQPGKRDFVLVQIIQEVKMSVSLNDGYIMAYKKVLPGEIICIDKTPALELIERGLAVKQASSLKTWIDG